MQRVGKNLVLLMRTLRIELEKLMVQMISWSAQLYTDRERRELASEETPPTKTSRLLLPIRERRCTRPSPGRE